MFKVTSTNMVSVQPHVYTFNIGERFLAVCQAYTPAKPTNDVQIMGSCGQTLLEIKGISCMWTPDDLTIIQRKRIKEAESALVQQSDLSIKDLVC